MGTAATWLTVAAAIASILLLAASWAGWTTPAPADAIVEEIR